MLNKTVSFSSKFNALPDDTCRLFATWTIAQLDHRGVYYAEPVIVRSVIMPMRDDVTLAQVAGYMIAMHNAGLIQLFEQDGRQWQSWPGFADNQSGLRKEREKTDFPAPPETIGDMPDFWRQFAATLPPLCRQNDAEKPAEVNLNEIKRNEVQGEGKEQRADARPPEPEKPESPKAPEPEQPRKKPGKPADPLLSNPAVVVYRDVMHRTPNELQRAIIAEKAQDVDRWRATLENWRAHSWNPGNVPGMIQSYDKPIAPIPAQNWPRRGGSAPDTPAARANRRMGFDV